MDGNGNIVENSDGSIKYSKTDNGANTPQNGENAIYTEGKNSRAIPIVYCSYKTNCAGFALTGSMNISMDTNYGDEVLKDEYQKVNNTNDVQAGDVVVFKSNQTGISVHFGRVVEVNKDASGKVTDVQMLSTDGANPKFYGGEEDKIEPDAQSVKQSVYNKDTYREYYHKNAGTNPQREPAEHPNCTK